MRKLILVVHTSLDGFVAGTKGELDGFQPGEKNMQFVCDLTESADAALFGRISYQLLQAYWPAAKELPDATKGMIAYSNWYNNAQKIVCSKTLSEGGLTKTTIINSNVPDEISKIKAQDGKDILIFGSPSLSQLLMQHNLIDCYWIFINPTIFGQGIPLFKELEKKSNLELIKTKQFPNGEIALQYEVKR
ncbi:MAG TPA: dihydrofolate reductase family protein [Puia sp.]|nr:dihydrofolate reductase family protein [Puia sp.]